MPATGFTDVRDLDDAAANATDGSSNSKMAGRSQAVLIRPGDVPLRNTGNVAGRNAIRANQVPGGTSTKADRERRTFKPSSKTMEH